MPYLNEVPPPNNSNCKLKFSFQIRSKFSLLIILNYRPIYITPINLISKNEMSFLIFKMCILWKIYIFRVIFSSLLCSVGHYFLLENTTSHLWNRKPVKNCAVLRKKKWGTFSQVVCSHAVVPSNFLGFSYKFCQNNFPAL